MQTLPKGVQLGQQNVGLLQFTAQLQEHGTFILEAPANGPYTKNNKD